MDERATSRIYLKDDDTDKAIKLLRKNGITCTNGEKKQVRVLIPSVKKAVEILNRNGIKVLNTKDETMTRAANILEKAKSVEPKNESSSVFSTRISAKGLKASKLDALEKKILTMSRSIVPDLEADDIEIIMDGDKKHFRVNIDDVPFSLQDKMNKAVQKAVR